MNAKDTVLAYLDALNHENFTTARKLISDDFVFRGVMGNRDGGDDYMKDMEKMKMKYRVSKVFTDGNDISVAYDIDMSGKRIFSMGWYHVADGKIDHFKVLFDPRPLLEESNKN